MLRIQTLSLEYGVSESDNVFRWIAAKSILLIRQKAEPQIDAEFSEE
jgi:hypothetical protein